MGFDVLRQRRRVVGSIGIGPMTSSVSTRHSTTELTALAPSAQFPMYKFQIKSKNPISNKSRRRPESNRRITVLQTVALPLGYCADRLELSHDAFSFSRNYNRTMIRRLVLCFVMADNFIFNLVKKPFKTKWILEGKCRKCGRCCRDIGMKIDPRLLQSSLITDIIVRWISWLFNFELKHIEYDSLLIVFTCKKSTPEGTCGDYKWRPNICRNYPIVDYFDKPGLFDTCGYSAKLRE